MAYETAAIRTNLSTLQAIRTGLDNALATAARINAKAPEQGSAGRSHRPSPS
ncbi:hypothetical protein [Streptomyces sp. NPDC048710]|uniref:hypothetical protein n=1 Tax=unclassified Streptomyces TaxID=2593676 RepID=UPI0037143048